MTPRTFKANSIKEAVDRVKTELGQDAMILSTKRLPRGPQNPYGKDLFEVTASLQDDLTDLLPPPSRTPAPPAWDGVPLSGGDLSGIRGELAAIREMLSLSQGTGSVSKLFSLPQVSLNLYAKLIASGISENHVWACMQRGGGFDREKAADPETVARGVLAAVLEGVEVMDPFASPSGERRVAAFVGPTGVGKTTTIAKLCAELSLKGKKKVGVISIDSYRIGAVEQLKTYAGIMGLPFLSAFTREELEKALQKMEGRDVVLIDTAGQSHQDMARLSAMGKLLGSGAAIETHLVLSAGMKSADMKEAGKNFAMLAPVSYVFTKVDETRTRGSMVDQLLAMKLPVSFIANGQRVPEDITSATRRKVLKMILEN